jgi:hypothetical protein
LDFWGDLGLEQTGRVRSSGRRVWVRDGERGFWAILNGNMKLREGGIDGKGFG